MEELEHVFIGWEDGDFLKKFEENKDEIPKMVGEKGLKTLLLNFKELNYFFSLETINHLIENWIPNLCDAGLEKLGILVPSKELGQLSVKNTFGGEEGGCLQVGFFDDLAGLKEFVGVNENIEQ